MDSLRDKAALMGLGAAIAAAGFWLGTRNAGQAAACCSRNTHGTGHATASDAGQGDPSPVASTPRLGRALDRLEKLMDQREREQATKRRHQHAVEAEMALLRRQLRHARQLADKDGSGAPSTQALGRQTSALSTGERVELSPTQLEHLRSVFALFDTDNSGTIGHAEIKNLHTRLGESITDAEAHTALAAMHAVDGEVSFENFVKYWDNAHMAGMFGDRKGERYAARFKFLAAKINNPETARFYTRASGSPHLGDYRVNFYTTGDDGQELQVSPWHDVPLRTTRGTYNFICEIPKWTRKKYEIATGEEFNPIRQDLDKSGTLREYTWGDMLFNYGAFPQTWEDPSVVSEHTHQIGDNDPIDVVEIGGRSWSTGSIVEVKVLGVLALIDSGETDWKVLCINVKDPMAKFLQDVEDVQSHMPGAIEALRNWLRDYKSHKGITNTFAMGGECQDRAFAEEIVEECYQHWKRHPDNQL